MDNKKDMKKEMLIMVVLLLLVITLVGVSYAAFNYSGIGKRANTITTGSITMSYEESDNTISLNGALPTTDKTGMKRLNPGEYFDFTVNSKIVGNVNINYEISAKEIGDGTIDGKYIKLYLTRIKEDGTEEELMVPEVYNEEDTTNEYTGRPNGEMSLYTSSMNSSESNKYRLRMYVDESYNPQDDGGGLTFSVQVNVYGKSGDKYVPLTTKEILEDNEVQEEKTSMFNYASNGVQFDPNDEDDGMTDPNPEYAISGIFASEDEDGVSYYYRGAVENNNVQFGQYENDYYVYSDGYYFYQSKESCMEDSHEESGCTPVKLANAGDKMYWKIVRVNGDGSLRLIYNGTSATPTNSDLVNSYAIGNASYNLQYNDPKYAGYTYDRDTNETDSFIKREIDTWYQNTLGNTEYDSKVIGGRFCSDSSGYKYDETFGYNVFASYDRLGQSMTNYAKANAPTLKCPATSESYGGSYRLKVGLITADELVLAGENPGVITDGYLNTGNSNMYYWTMSPAYFNIGYASVWYEFGFLSHNYVHYYYAARPVINVTTDNMSLIGDGTLNNPYMLEGVEPTNSYKGKVTIEVGSSIDDIKAFEENLDLSGVTWTVEDSSIAKIENGKIIGLKNGTTTITGVGSDGTTYEIEVTVITNPITSSAVYIGIGIILVLVLGTGIYVTYKVNNVVDKE